MIRYKYNNKEKEIRCNFCNTDFLYADSDIIDLDERHYGFICPECGNEIIIEERTPFKFPQSFFQFGKGKILSDSEIQEGINIVRKNLEDNKKSFYHSWATGDTIIFGEKEDNKYINIYVAKNYYSTSYTIE